MSPRRAVDEQTLTESMTVQNHEDAEKTEDRGGPTIVWAERTDVGRTRSENQDALGQRDYGELRLWVVCDGMGGHAGGSTASRLAVHTLLDRFGSARHDDPRERLDIAIRAANDRVYEEALSIRALRGMGTTTVCLLLDVDAKRAYVAHVGDSRAYLAREGRFKRVTLDHTMVQFMVDDGLLSEQEAAEHPHGNIIARSLGSKTLKIEHQEPIDLEEGDLFLMCTDGLSGRMTDANMAEIVWSHEPEAACEALVDLANERGGEDNITVQIVLFGQRGERPESIEIVRAKERPASLHPEEDGKKESEAFDFKRIEKAIAAKKQGPAKVSPLPRPTGAEQEDDGEDLLDFERESTASDSGARPRAAGADAAAMPAVLIGVALGLVAFLVVYLS